MQEVKDKLTKIEDTLVEIKTDTARNTVSLEYHIKRTDLLERIVLMVLGTLLASILGVVAKILLS